MLSRFVPLLAAMISSICVACPSTADEPNGGASRNNVGPPTEKLSNSWSRVVPIVGPTPGKKIGQWRIWIEEGWLLAERRTVEDKVEWEVVLAEVVGDEPPEIVGDEIDTLRLNYRDGRYFIRDFHASDGAAEVGCLRIRRQPKTSESPWPGLPVPRRERDAPASFSGGLGWSLRGVVSDSWYTITAGPNKKGEQPFADCVVRVCHIDIRVPAFGGGGGGGGVLRKFYGNWFMEDDGELLVANRLEAWALPQELELRAKDDPALAARLAMKTLAGAPAPELSGEAWLNADRRPTLKTLRGKPVMLVLFDLRQRSFVPLVTPLLSFEETYRKQGLVVLGVCPKLPRDQVAEDLADEHITFPVLIDDGKTEERLGINFSACLLIDREGNVVSVYKDSLAPPADIEKLLELNSGDR